MKKAFIRRSVYILLLCIGLLASMLITVSAGGSGKTYIDFPVNENKQTYGSGIHSEHENIEKPDLILAMGIDGTEGYVLKSDLEGTGPLQRPQNAEEALVYNEQLEALIREAEARGEEYVYYIPLYESDGRTVIGKFGVSIPISRDVIG